MGFLRYNKAIVFCSAFVLGAYGIYFYYQGYQEGLAFLGWAAVAIIAVLICKRNPHIVFLSLFVLSLIMYYVMKSYIPQVGETPNYQVFIAIIFLHLGCGIDGLYWVYKYDRGTKIRNSYED